MKTIEYDVSQKGLMAVLRDYEEIALRILWESSEGLNSRSVHERVNKKLSPNSISRASIINYLEDLREMGVLHGEEKSGKGGYHWVYKPAMDESGFKKYIVETLLGNLKRDFPEETKKAISQIK